MLFYPPKHRDEPQKIELVYKEKTPLRTAGQKPKSGQREIPLSSLRPQFNLIPSTAKIDEQQEIASSIADWKESQSYDGVYPTGGQSLSVAQITFIDSMWRMIDQYIEENPFLSEYNHTGKVFLRFDVDEHGRLINLRASAADRALKVIAARAVRRAIRNETGDVHFPPQRMSIFARFTWTGYQACHSLRGVRENFLSFCHYAENKRKKFSAGEKTATWAGAIANHGPWAYEEIQKYRREESRRKSQFDPFRKYELDPDWNL